MKYTEEELIKHFYELKSKLGRVPKIKEFKLMSPVNRIWGSYNIFLKDIGEKNFNERIKDKYIQEVKDYVKIHGKRPSSIGFTDITTIARIFGSWNNMLLESGVDDIREIRKINMNNEELLEYYIDLCNAENKIITSKELDKTPEYINGHVFAGRFGGFGKFLKIVTNDKRLKIKDKEYRVHKEKYSDEELAEHLKQYLEQEKKVTIQTFKEYLKKNKLASINTYKSRFGVTSFKRLVEVI